MAFQSQSVADMVARQSGNVLMTRNHVPWFNPREMDDATVLQLNTGREALLAQLFADIHERIAQPGIFNHWLLTGARGAGKSFFLRLVQVSFAQAFQGKARFVLLPEEHRNIYAPHEFLAETRRMLRVDQGDLGAPPAWRVADPDQAWRTALGDLLTGFEEPLLVIGVENFDQLLEQAFSEDVDSSRLRQLMSNEPRIMLVATAVHGSFDENYDQRMFRQFEHHPIPPWDATDHRDYLSRRAQRNGQQASRRQLAKVEAYSHYTGGNARAAAVLAGAILDQDDPLQAATDLDAAIEKMSDYYRALLDRIPPKTRKLFDALVRGGEPASQTEIARRTGAQQNDIARAFLWLVDQGYVNESRQPGSKAKSYQVRDRLLVQFYRMRSLSPGQRSKLALMAELLADTLAFQDKWQFAQRYASQGHAQQALDEHLLAYQECLAQGEVSSAAWNLGQSARHTATLEGSDAAWTVLDQDLSQVPGQENWVIQQLGDAVADVAQKQGIPKAFSLAVALLQGLAQRPHLPIASALRALWIDMVAEAVPHDLLRDLLAEWPHLFAAELQPELSALSPLLLAWLDDLDTPADQRSARRDKLDPDLATTLAALSQALPKSAQRRLLLEAPSLP